MTKNRLIRTPIKTIRQKCLECTGGQYKQVRYCTVLNCPLYPYRMGKRPDLSTLESLKQYYEEK